MTQNIPTPFKGISIVDEGRLGVARIHRRPGRLCVARIKACPYDNAEAGANDASLRFNSAPWHIAEAVPKFVFTLRWTDDRIHAPYLNAKKII